MVLLFFSGSGKTAAFLIPILSRIFEEGPPPLPDVRKFNDVYKILARKASGCPVDAQSWEKTMKNAPKP